MIDKIKAWMSLYNQAKRIFDSDADWSAKGALLFSDEIHGEMQRLFYSDRWCPHYSTFEDGVKSWMVSHEEMHCNFKAILKVEEPKSIMNYNISCVCGWHGGLYSLEQHMSDALCPNCRTILVGVSSGPLGFFRCPPSSGVCEA